MPHNLPKTRPLGSESVFQVALSSYVSIFLLCAAYPKFLAPPYVGFIKYNKNLPLRDPRVTSLSLPSYLRLIFCFKSEHLYSRDSWSLLCSSAPYLTATTTAKAFLPLPLHPAPSSSSTPCQRPLTLWDSCHFLFILATSFC